MDKSFLSRRLLLEARSAPSQPLNHRAAPAASRAADPLAASRPAPYSRLSRSPGRPLPGSRPPSEPDPISGGPSAEAVETRRDPFWFIKMLRSELTDHEFAYMNVADSGSTTWDPYNLQIVAFPDVNPRNHYTISEAGVTHCMRRGTEEVVEFTPLDQWERDCGHFQKVMEIPFFKRYRSWKSYYSWKRAIQSEKIAGCKAVLTQNLFILNRRPELPPSTPLSLLPLAGTSRAALHGLTPNAVLPPLLARSTFQPSLLRVRELCVEISQLKLHQIRKGTAYQLDQFVEVQAHHKQVTCAKLEVFYDAVRDAVQAACDAGIAQFELELSDGTPRGEGQGRHISSDSSALRRDGEKRGESAKRSFLQQAQLRTVCKKITNYIRVVDYIVLSTLHQLLMGSLGDLLTMFNEVPYGYVEKATDEEPQREAGDGALFLVDIYFQQPDSIEFSPSAADFSTRIDATISEFVNMLKCRVGTLLSNERFKRFTQPVINGRQDAPDLNEGFDIVGLIEDNDAYNRMVEGIKASFDHHFMEVVEYVKILEPHKGIYLENQELDLKAYHASPLEEWRELMDTFKTYDEMFHAIPAAATIGIFQANNHRVKELFMPLPRRCLAEIHRTLPDLAAQLTRILLDETTNAQERLNTTPENVAEFVQYSEFLTKTNERQKEFGERGNSINAMYAMMADYSVVVPDADAASVKMMETMLGHLTHLVAQVESQQEEKTNAFTEKIETSIEELRTNASELRQQSEDKSLYDGNTEMIDALAFLERLDAAFQELKADSSRFSEYQEVLKVPVTRYDEVEELEGNLRLKKNMWQSLSDWGEQIEKWSNAPFDSLNTEHMQQQVQRYAKVVNQCEKGLPANTVLPILREKVDTFKVLVPVVVALRNEALRQHHWEQIELAIHSDIDRGDAFTLGYLLELRVQEYKEQIEAISTAATQEQVLEDLLSKVEGAWKTLEFAVNPYKDQKDVFILGGVDDVMAVLEETQVTDPSTGSLHLERRSTLHPNTLLRPAHTPERYLPCHPTP